LALTTAMHKCAESNKDGGPYNALLLESRLCCCKSQHLTVALLAGKAVKYESKGKKLSTSLP